MNLSEIGNMSFLPTTSITRACLGLLALTLVAHPLLAQQQQVRVRASLEEKQIAQGVYTYLTVLIEGGQPENIPEVIQVEGLEIVRKVYSPRMTSINGVLKTEVTVMYGVVGRKPGKYEIPSLSFVINGIPYQTEAQTLEIVEMAGDQELSAERPYFLTFKAAKTEAYVNELVPIELHLFVRGSGTIGSAGRPKFENGEKFVIKPFPHQYHVELKQIDGIPFTTVRFPTRIAALSPGNHKLGPASTEANVTRPMNTLFPRNFLQFSEPRTISSQELEFNIKPLPEAGKPESFQNTVGRFEMAVSASPTDLRVGDPIFVDIQVKGKGNFDSLVAPQLAEETGWKAYQPNRIDDEDRDDIEQTVSFNQVVIPTTEHAELPPLELSFFDPEKAEYVVLRSDAIPLIIQPDSVTAERTASSGLAAVGIPSEQLDDILFIHSGNATWTPINASVFSRPSFWLWQLFPALAFSALVGVWGQKRLNSWLSGRSKTDDDSLEAVKRKIQGNVSRDDFYEAILEYVERHRGRLSQLPSDARSKLDAIYKTGNHFLYSGMKQAANKVNEKEKQQTLQALGELEQLRLKTT